MRKFTKGPWQVLPEEADKDYIRIRGTVCGGRYKVANVPTPTYEGVHPRELEETQANAALIAAAPELLAALEAVIEWYDMEADHSIEPDFYKRMASCQVSEDMAREAIAKAKGGKA